MTVLQRLIKHPHAAVFDKAPGSALALRVRHPNGCTWEVADEVLAVTAGEVEKSYDLSLLTVGQLAAALVADGFEVLSLSPYWVNRSALVLVEGDGDQGESNGDHLQAFTSILWTFMAGYGAQIRGAKYQVGQALRQMVITQAEGEWLDLWGTLYATERNDDESDAAYAPRIPREAFRIRVNALGIEKAVFDATGWDVRIEEPWTEIFYLDYSTLSGSHRLYDGARTGYHIIQPTSRQEVDWARVLKIIDRNRAAGVMVLAPLVRRISLIDASEGGSVIGGGHSQITADVLYQDRPLLDYSIILDDNSDAIVNHPSRQRREYMTTTHTIVPSQTWAEFPWLSVPWSTKYLVQSGHTRTYRVYFLDLAYRSNFWTPRRTWATAEAPWSGLDPIIESVHARSES